MTMLSDGDILRAVRQYSGLVTPFERQHVQPASLDLSLAPNLLVMERDGRIDPEKSGGNFFPVDLERGVPFWINPGQFILAATCERFHFPTRLAGRLEGKSSLGRLGIMVHSTAGFFDPGFQGTATLELSNVGTCSVLLRPGMTICQMSFHALSSPALVPYGSPGLGSKYQGQSTAEPSRYHNRG